MTWLTSLMAALISGVAGGLLAGFIANACVSWYGVSSREGASGYFVLFLAIGGGVAGFLVGLVVSRITAVQIGPGFLQELAAALGAVLLVAGVSALLARRLADVPPELEGRDLILEVEFRFPNTHRGQRPPTADGIWEYTFASLSGDTCRKREPGRIESEAARFENGQWIVPTAVDLFTERGRRSVSIAPKEAKEAFGFLLPLPRRPGLEFLEWSGWIPRQQPNGQPWPADRMSCRFRVRKTVPPPPPPSEADRKAEQTAEEEARFVSIPADAPVQAWFPYLAYEQPHTPRALERIGNRPGLVAELGRLVVSNDPKLAHDALRCISLLPSPPKELIPAVEAAGREIAARITTFNHTPAEKDPNFETAVDPATRFYGWLPAAKALREKCGADFTSELSSILELSRRRPESHCMRQDICRVASFYLHEWAGIAPLPTDPEPR